MKDLQKHINILTVLLLLLIPSTLMGSSRSSDLALDVICIDPGHGGKDPGCVARDGTREKDIVLSIGVKLRKMLAEKAPSVKVVMTRSDDRFIPLGDRANIANRNGAKLFISLHVNAVDPARNKNYASVSGYSVHTLGQSRTGADLYSSNMEMCRRENSVILLEDDHETRYEGFNPNDPESYIIFNLMQNSNLVQSLDFASKTLERLEKGPLTKSRGISQDPYLVLWKTTMPAVLLECGFITNQKDLASIKTDAGQEEIARRICEAILLYKAEYEGQPVPEVKQAVTSQNTAGKDGASSAGKTTAAESAHSEKATVSASKLYYGIQVLASAKDMADSDPFFKSYAPTRLKSGNLYRYLLAASESLEEVRSAYPEILKKFPGCFMVKVEDGKTERLR